MKLSKTIISRFTVILAFAALCTAASAQERIAFESTRDGNWEIYTMAPDGSNHVRLTNDPALDSSPAISPQGRQIVFTSDRTGNQDIFIINSDGTEGYSVKEVLETAEKVTGRPIKRRLAPRRAGDPPTLIASSELINRELGWQPRHGDLSEIIGSAWAWMQKERAYGTAGT